MATGSAHIWKPALSNVFEGLRDRHHDVRESHVTLSNVCESRFLIRRSLSLVYVHLRNGHGGASCHSRLSINSPRFCKTSQSKFSSSANYNPLFSLSLLLVKYTGDLLSALLQMQNGLKNTLSRMILKQSNVLQQ
jgi:hypothetical protein